jgi:hypothetical protein
MATRLEKILYRLEAQYACITWALQQISGRPGVVFELGLGLGRTFHHLRHHLPDRRIVVFERQIASYPDCTPDPDQLILGDLAKPCPPRRGSSKGQVILAHSDVGTFEAAHNAAMAKTRQHPSAAGAGAGRPGHERSAARTRGAQPSTCPPAPARGGTTALYRAPDAGRSSPRHAPRLALRMISRASSSATSCGGRPESRASCSSSQCALMDAFDARHDLGGVDVAFPLGRHRDDAPGIDHVVRRIEDAALVQALAVGVGGQLVVGRPGHHLDLERRDGPGGEDAAKRARRQDVGLAAVIWSAGTAVAPNSLTARSTLAPFRSATSRCARPR